MPPTIDQRADWQDIFAPPPLLAFVWKQYGEQAFREVMAELVAARTSMEKELNYDACVLYETGLEDVAKIVERHRGDRLDENAR
jgi:hypothetical protein